MSRAPQENFSPTLPRELPKALTPNLRQKERSNKLHVPLDFGDWYGNFGFVEKRLVRLRAVEAGAAFMGGAADALQPQQLQLQQQQPAAPDADGATTDAKWLVAMAVLLYLTQALAATFSRVQRYVAL